MTAGEVIDTTGHPHVRRQIESGERWEYYSNYGAYAGWWVTFDASGRVVRIERKYEK